MSAESKTPRTDAAIVDWNKVQLTMIPAVSSKDMRQLETELAAAQERIQLWETELSQVMPADFKDWWENSKAEWPVVARIVIESLRKRELLALERPQEREERLRHALEEIFNHSECPAWIYARIQEALATLSGQRFVRREVL